MSNVDIPSPHGRLEALFWQVPEARGAALVCHPHPLFGGTMDNNVTWRLADAFRQAGLSTLRFNFRGVGRSTGLYDEGRGEVDDAALALAWLAQQAPGLPLYLGGFSFGSYVALRLASQQPEVKGVVVVGMAPGLLPYDFARTLPLPKAFVHGDSDEFTPLSEVEAYVAGCTPPRTLIVVEACDHMARGRQEAMARAARSAVDFVLGGGHA